MSRNHVRLFLSIAATAVIVASLNYPIMGGFRLGPLLEPFDGLYRTARHADRSSSGTIRLSGVSEQVRVIRDERGVPHIFAKNDRDAVTALGYTVAQDRLFQIDFIARAALGELAEVFGPSALETDQFFVQMGLRWAADRQVERLIKEAGTQLDLITWYQSGVNAYIEELKPQDYPFEFRLLGYEPRKLTPKDAVSVLLYMSYDLSFTTKDFQYEVLRDLVPSDDFEQLFPAYSKLSVPIVSSDSSSVVADPLFDRPFRAAPDFPLTLDKPDDGRPVNTAGDLVEGLVPGKGSNNWAVDGDRSETGFPILAGDMHLNLSLPSIWYEAHLVTSEMNVYGVTIPGAPTIIEGITDQTAWAYTNTGSDQIDYFRLQLSDDHSGYIVDGEYQAFETRVEQISIAGEDPVTDTLFYSMFGPVRFDNNSATSMRWTAHESSRTMLATWLMGKAENYEEFQDATRHYDSPMQNILYADRAGTIAIRSTGYNPVRQERGSGMFVLDGKSAGNQWEGRIPFDELPASVRPLRGYLTSTNQQPSGDWYPYYLGGDWRDSFRSIRIDDLLSGKEKHSTDDFRAYQADVYVMQAEYFLPLLDSVSNLTPRANIIKEKLLAWDRKASVDQVEPILFHEFFGRLKELAWDESVFRTVRAPAESRLYRLLTEDPDSKWLDITSTAITETADVLLAQALESVAEKFGSAVSADQASLKWGNQHKLEIRHITRSGLLRPLWRGPFVYPGYSQTLSPARGMTATSSASWRVIVDFSTIPPSAFGVYPGGQNGNPFSERYDDFIKTFLDFQYYSLFLPGSASEFADESILHEFVIHPAPRD